MEDHSFEDLIENLFDGVYYVDCKRTITYWNAAAERITGYERAEVLGKPCAANILRHIDEAGTELCQNGCPLAATLQDGQSREINVYLHHNQGYRLPVAVRVSPVRDESGAIVGAAEVFTENAELRQVLNDLEALRQKASHDELTCAGNRRAAEIALKTRFFELHQFGTPFGLVFLDIDYFKQINDAHGHGVGDQVLRLAANTLAAALRRGDLLVRWGGEEFLVLCPETNLEQAAILAERLCRAVREHDFQTTRRHTVSAGVAELSESDTVDSLLNRTDQALYQAKNGGRDRVQARAATDRQ